MEEPDPRGFLCGHPPGEEGTPGDGVFPNWGLVNVVLVLILFRQERFSRCLTCGEWKHCFVTPPFPVCTGVTGVRRPMRFLRIM